MKQIRIVRDSGSVEGEDSRFTCEWMEASLMNRWLLKTRLDEALARHGAGSHRIESRDKQQTQQSVGA